MKRRERPEIDRNGNRSDSYNRQHQNAHPDGTKVAPVTATTERESTQVLPDRSHPTAMNMKETRGEYVALRKVTVVIKNGTRRMVVNAVLDDASRKTYINSNVAAELGPQGKNRRVIVNVLNVQTDSF